MDRRGLIAVLICMGIYLGWERFYVRPHMAQQTAAAPATAEQPAAQTAPAQSATPVFSAPPQGVSLSKPISLASATSELQTSSGPAAFSDGQIGGYHSADGKPITLASLAHHANGLVRIAFDANEYADIPKAQGHLSSDPKGGSASWFFEDARMKLKRTISISPNSSTAQLLYEAQFKSKAPQMAYVYLEGKGDKSLDDAPDQQLVYFTANSLERVALSGSIDAKQVVTPVKYIGLTNRYFALALLPQVPWEPKALVQPVTADEGRLSLVFPITGNAVSIPLNVYFGPKVLNSLRAVDPALDSLVDFGWFTVIAYPLLKALNWLNQFVHNYGIAIILLTVALKVVTFPLNYTSMKKMKEMAKIQPQLTAIREKYKDDKQKLNEETLKLMRTSGYNPAAGCVPLLIQMPVFFALYRVLYSSIELYQAPFGFWLHDLSAKDPYYVLPILWSITGFLQQKLTPQTATDPAQQKMLQFMPLMFGFFMITMPSGLGIYMLVNTLVSILQQVFMNKRLSLKNASPAVASRA